jgi:spore coat polysaccharide biosynthesis predicted glycosyltransferase SpsG/RimJ/RimL family protein N-acetyltransferase
VRALAVKIGTSIIEIPRISPDPSDLNLLKTVITSVGDKSWSAIDGYSFDAAYLSALRAAGSRVLRVDDGPSGEVPCDAFLDPNPGSETSTPSLPSEALPLLGPRWTPIRSSFAHVGEGRTNHIEAQNLLISFGGWDPEDATSLALRALRRMKRPFEAVVVIGPDNPRAETLNELAEGLPVHFERMADMPALMGKADLALIGGGVTMLEACAAGLPALVATVAKNQEAGAANMAERGLVRALGRATDLNEDTLARALDELLLNTSERDHLSRAGRTVVDGHGAVRIANTLRTLSEPRLSKDRVRLRPAVPEDALDIWRIANDPSVRAKSFRKDSIPLPIHIKWFEDQLNNTSSRFWVVEVGHVIAGQVRYTRTRDEVEVHYSVLGAFRGKGLGTLALSQSRHLACREFGAKRLTGVVITPNEASERSFLSAGWMRKGVETRNDNPCSIFEAVCS